VKGEIGYDREKEDGKVCKVCKVWTRNARKVKNNDEEGPNVNL
jgi:hypothetical protein